MDLSFHIGAYMHEAVLNAAKTASSRARCSNAVGLKGHKVQGQMLGMLQVLSQGLQELKDAQGTVLPAG